jgi:dihydrodipicolinate synthase/N-acetylneuraminate lyase
MRPAFHRLLANCGSAAINRGLGSRRLRRLSEEGESGRNRINQVTHWLTIPLAALGGRGVISVVSNEIPREMTALTQYALANQFGAARDLQRKYLHLMEVNFVESNPIPVKAAMALMGLLEPVWRLPMCAPSAANQAKIEKVLETLGLLTEGSVHAG